MSYEGSQTINISKCIWNDATSDFYIQLICYIYNMMITGHYNSPSWSYICSLCTMIYKFSRFLALHISIRKAPQWGHKKVNTLINKQTPHKKKNIHVLRLTTQTHEENLKKETTFTWKKTVELDLIYFRIFFLFWGQCISKRTQILYVLTNKRCLFLRPHDIINNYIWLCFVVVYLFVLVCLKQLPICFRQWSGI